jgi:hypothetical protein
MFGAVRVPDVATAGAAFGTMTASGWRTRMGWFIASLLS